MPVLIGGMFAVTITMALPIATATTTRLVVTMSIGLMRCASARSGGGIYMTSSAAGVGANCGGHCGYAKNDTHATRCEQEFIFGAGEQRRLGARAYCISENTGPSRGKA